MANTTLGKYDSPGVVQCGSSWGGEEGPKQGDLLELTRAVWAASYPGFKTIFGRYMFLCAPLTNSHHHVNETSQNQDYRDDLTEAPGVFARLND